MPHFAAKSRFAQQNKLLAGRFNRLKTAVFYATMLRIINCGREFGVTPKIISKYTMLAAILLLAACAHRAPQAAATPASKNLAKAPASSSVNPANNNDVQIFSLDGPANAAAVSENSIASAASSTIAASDEKPSVPPISVASSSDSSVTIYPLSGGNSDDAPLPTPHEVADTASAITSPSAAFIPTRVYFADNSARLNKSGQYAVRGAAQTAGVVSVEGHASSRVATNDPVQGRIINLKISMQRAIAVSHRLVADGVSPASIKMVAYGDTRPSLPVNGKSAEAASRRVEIYSIDRSAGSHE